MGGYFSGAIRTLQGRLGSKKSATGSSGFFTGPARWLLGRLGAPSGGTVGGVCATVSVAPQVNAVVTVQVC